MKIIQDKKLIIILSPDEASELSRKFRRFNSHYNYIASRAERYFDTDRDKEINGFQGRLVTKDVCKVMKSDVLDRVLKAMLRFEGITGDEGFEIEEIPF